MAGGQSGVFCKETGNAGRQVSDVPPRARGVKGRMNKSDLIKLKTFCMAKENISKRKREPTVWENICQ